jgi:hypothetical protein
VCAQRTTLQAEIQNPVWDSDTGPAAGADTRTRPAAAAGPRLLRFQVEYGWRSWVLGASSDAVLAHVLHLTVGSELRAFLDDVAARAWSNGYCRRRRLSLRLRRVE